MRTDDQCQAAYLDRQEASLAALGERDLRGYARVAPDAFLALLPAIYLGIRDPRLAELAASGQTKDLILCRLWQPQSAEDLTVCRETLHVALRFLADEQGRPSVQIMPGPYLPVFHPHVLGFYPAHVCLVDDYRPDTTTAADLCLSLVAMLRFEPGTWSVAPQRALALGAAQWLAGPGREAFDLPLRAPTPDFAGLRVLEGATGHD